MNIRKPIDYSVMYMELDTVLEAGLSQMDLYCEIGRITSRRPAKGAAVTAAEYLRKNYPDATGFSPRNVRRMREFYRTYESAPELLGGAMKISWTQNVVILEAELSPTERAWYIRAAKHFNWSKLELMANIKDCAHKTLSCDFAPSSSEETSPAVINESIGCTEISQRQTSIKCNDRKPVVNTWTVLSQTDSHAVHKRRLSTGPTHPFRQFVQLLCSSTHRSKFISRHKSSHSLSCVINPPLHFRCPRRLQTCCRNQEERHDILMNSREYCTPLMQEKAPLLPKLKIKFLTFDFIVC